MATTAEELIVAIRSDGVSETRDDLEGVEKTMDETADSAGTAAEDLEGFSQRFKGAMAAAVAGLAVGISGLAAGVPVVGELFAGIGAIIGALLFQVDMLARELGAGGLTETFFNIADAIYNLEGAAGDIVGVLTVIGTLAATVAAGIAAWAVKTMGAVGAASALGGALKAAAVAIGSFLAGLSALTIGLAVAVAALLAFVAAYLTNFRGVRDTTDEIVGDIIDTVVTGFLSLAAQAIVAVSNFSDDVRTFFTDIASDLATWASDLASAAYEWGVGIVEGLLDGIQSIAQSIVDALITIVNGVIRTINLALDTLPEEVTSRVDFDQLELIQNQNISDSRGSGGSTSGRPRFGSGTTTGGTQLDGRQLIESTGRYRSDPNRRRGL